MFLLMALCCIATWCVLCDVKSQKSATTFSGDSAVRRPLGQPYDYFPTAVGTRWSFVITTTGVEGVYGDEPLMHKVVSWPVGANKVAKIETRGILYRKDESKPARLTYSIKAKAQKQGPLQYPEGYEILIEQDDLGIYKDTENVFWAISRSDRYNVNEIVLYSPRSSGAPSGGLWGSYGQESGNGMRVSFFGSEPGTSIGLADEHDATLFVGQTVLNGVACLHFIRIVEEKKGDDKPSYLDKKFTEDMWFGKGISLMKLVQQVGRNVTMTWVLER
jgi:hypothetical protein